MTVLSYTPSLLLGAMKCCMEVASPANRIFRILSTWFSPLDPIDVRRTYEGRREIARLFSDFENITTSCLARIIQLLRISHLPSRLLDQKYLS